MFVNRSSALPSSPSLLNSSMNSQTTRVGKIGKREMKVLPPKQNDLSPLVPQATSRLSSQETNEKRELSNGLPFMSTTPNECIFDMSVAPQNARDVTLKEELRRFAKDIRWTTKMMSDESGEFLYSIMTKYRDLDESPIFKENSVDKNIETILAYCNFKKQLLTLLQFIKRRFNGDVLKINENTDSCFSTNALKDEFSKTKNDLSDHITILKKVLAVLIDKLQKQSEILKKINYLATSLMYLETQLTADLNRSLDLISSMQGKVSEYTNPSGVKQQTPKIEKEISIRRLFNEHLLPSPAPIQVTDTTPLVDVKTVTDSPFITLYTQTIDAINVLRNIAVINFGETYLELCSDYLYFSQNSLYLNINLIEHLFTPVCREHKKTVVGYFLQIAEQIKNYKKSLLAYDKVNKIEITSKDPINLETLLQNALGRIQEMVDHLDRMKTTLQLMCSPLRELEQTYQAAQQYIEKEQDVVNDDFKNYVLGYSTLRKIAEKMLMEVSETHSVMRKRLELEKAALSLGLPILKQRAKRLFAASRLFPEESYNQVENHPLILFASETTVEETVPVIPDHSKEKQAASQLIPAEKTQSNSGTQKTPLSASQKKRLRRKRNRAIQIEAGGTRSNSSEQLKSSSSNNGMERGATITISSQDATRREDADVKDLEEGIASAISEERSLTDALHKSSPDDIVKAAERRDEENIALATEPACVSLPDPELSETPSEPAVNLAGVHDQESQELREQFLSFNFEGFDRYLDKASLDQSAQLTALTFNLYRKLSEVLSSKKRERV